MDIRLTPHLPKLSTYHLFIIQVVGIFFILLNICIFNSISYKALQVIEADTFVRDDQLVIQREANNAIIENFTKKIDFNAWPNLISSLSTNCAQKMWSIFDNGSSLFKSTSSDIKCGNKLEEFDNFFHQNGICKSIAKVWPLHHNALCYILGINVDGPRKISFANGDLYVGNWEDGMQHGQGKYMYANGSTYEGYWRNGKYDGSGQLTVPDGSCYVGYWKEHKKHGVGKFTDANGSSYEGDWKGGIFDGLGKFTDINGDSYVGNFKADKQHGEGKYTYANGSFYEGDWRDGKQDGKGIFGYANGDQYEGEFKEDKKHGTGKLTNANGTCYDGSWKEDMLHGLGKLTYVNGSCYEGNFINDKRHGFGKYRLANGKCYEGDWKDDKFLRDSKKSERKQKNQPVNLNSFNLRLGK